MRIKLLKLIFAFAACMVVAAAGKASVTMAMTNDQAETYLKLMTCYDSVKDFEESQGLTDEDVVEIIQALISYGYSVDDISETCSNLDLTDYLVPEVKSNDIGDFQISGIKDMAYTGKKITFNITIKNGKKTLKQGTDYSVSYKNNQAIGKAAVTLKGKGSYKGTVTKSFKILPKKTELSSLNLKTSSNKVAFKWAKNKTATGYRIYYANEKEGEYTLLKAITKQGTTSYTSKSLTAGKTYYFMIKAYKIVGSTKYYSEGSKVEKVAILSSNGEVTVDINDGDDNIQEPYMLEADELKEDVMLCWKNFAECDSMELLRTEDGEVYTLIATLSSEQDMYIDKGAAGKGYSYTVRSVRGSENSLVYNIMQAASSEDKWYLGEYGYLRAEIENGEVKAFKEYNLDGSLTFNCDWRFEKLDYPIPGNEVDQEGNVVNVDRNFTYEISMTDGDVYNASEYITYSKEKFIETSTVTYKDKSVFHDVVLSRYY